MGDILQTEKPVPGGPLPPVKLSEKHPGIASEQETASLRDDG
jgi:hypothetical protein